LLDVDTPIRHHCHCCHYALLIILPLAIADIATHDTAISRLLMPHYYTLPYRFFAPLAPLRHAISFEYMLRFCRRFECHATERVRHCHAVSRAYRHAIIAVTAAIQNRRMPLSVVIIIAAMLP